MLKRMVLPMVFGLAGAAVLLSLGVWQLQRLAWKEGVLAGIAARMAEPPVAVPAVPDPVADRYLPVRAEGRLTGEEALVLASRKRVGPGFRVIAVLETPEGRRLLLDRGFLAEANRATSRPPKPLAVEGTLAWPDEVDAFTPPPDPAAGLWYARDVPALAAALRADPVLIVARSDTGDAVQPVPVDTAGIPNDHLGYAIQWFALAAVWLGMTILWLWRMRRRTV